MKGLPFWFMPLWCAVMPLTSFLLIPSVQGTIPAYVLGFVSAFFVMVSHNGGQQNIQRTRYIMATLVVAGIWLFLLSGSQLGHLISDRHDFGDMLLIDRSDTTSVVFRKTLFTQTLYLAACLCIALFFRFFFRAEWMRYVLWGGWFLAIYGIYEWLFFLIFKQPGDFLVNRTYAGGQTASWSQAIDVGPCTLLRIKSTFGEPSFFSAGVLPYLFLALEYKRKWLLAALLFCLVFSASSSAFIGLAFALLIYCLFQRKVSRSTALLILLFAGAVATLYFIFPDTFDAMFTAKLSSANESGQSHQANREMTNDTVNTFTFMNRLFGIGFGYSYEAVFYALLINTGWIGLIIYCYAFLKPAILLRPDNGALALKVGVLTLFFLYYVNVSELFLPTTWMFLGLAYWRLDQQKYERMAAQSGTIRSPILAR
jgi:hypothetical protein